MVNSSDKVPLKVSCANLYKKYVHKLYILTEVVLTSIVIIVFKEEISLVMIN